VSAPPGPRRYRVALYGGGIEECDREELRRRLALGELDGKTPVALVGTEAWQALASRPELAVLLRGGTDPASPSRAARILPSETLASRAVAGLAYPLTGGGIVTLVLLALLSQLPIISFFAGAAATFFAVQIVTRSSRGDTEMPFFESSDVFEMILIWLKTLFVSIVALAPLLAWFIWGFLNLRGTSGAALWITGLGAAGLFAAIYYPACFATVAVWESALDALNPVYVLRVVRTLGADYAVVVGVSLAGVVLGFLAPYFSARWVPLPFVAAVPGIVVALWAQFWAAHVLGWAIYRHERELGWE